MVIVAAPDKFRGTATALEVTDAIESAGVAAGADVRRCPLADGGEGTLDVFGGANRWTEVTGPLSARVNAGWRLDGARAVIEMSTASGLIEAGGAARNDPVQATSKGTGELLVAAMAAGARDLLVGLGGSASTDGGLGAVQALLLRSHDPLVDVRTRVCADVTTRFLDAARVFGPQKGADAAVVEQLSGRLLRIRGYYRDRFGIDVQELIGGGAAGGLAGGLAALGAELVDGFGTLADQAGLDAALDGADLVVTGEGRLDRGSFDGKVVGGVIARAAAAGVPVLVIVGDLDPEVVVPPHVTVVALLPAYGRDRAMTATAACVTAAVAAHLAGIPR